ncbi:MAG: hypothetical protein H6825_01410 [Planctomycetes bacterium]|nr:hypothetical protein [Planctomycetota bacterium]
MILPRVFTRALAIVFAALLAVPLAAQVEVTPANRTLVVTGGKSASFKITATGGCKPTWTAVSGNEAVASVSPDSAKAGASRSFKVKTGNLGTTDVIVTLVGAGADCAETIEVVIKVVVVMDAKGVTKVLLKGDKGTNIPGVGARLKDQKSADKDALKTMVAGLKTYLDSLKKGELVAFSGKTSQQEMGDLAVRLGEDLATDCFNSIFSSYAEAIEGMRADGYQALLFYGFGDFLYYAPKGFFEGACGEWDASTQKAWKAFVDTVNKIDALTKKYDGNCMKAVPGLGVVAMHLDPGEFTTGGLSPVNVGPTTFDIDADGSGKLAQKRPKATNYTDDEGSNSHGRITSKGMADPAGGELVVTYEKLDANGQPVSSPTENQTFTDSGVAVGDDCTWKSYAPGFADTPNLEPGRWRVTATQDGRSVSKEITIPN